MTKPLSLKTNNAAVVRPRVLIAEDSAVYRSLIQSALCDTYDLCFVGDGNSAWNLLQQPDAPRIVVLDWILPGMDGVEICTKLRSQLSEHYFYLLLLTARDSEQDLLTAMDAGADDFVKKPFSAAELRARLKAGARIIDLHEQLLATATYDGLTGIRNRTAIFNWLETELERCRRERKPLGLLLADIDHFKLINDSAGHLAGDQVLRVVATRITNSVRPYDAVGRFGGEEFLVGMPGSNLNVAQGRAEQIRAAICATPIPTDQTAVLVSVSLGVTVAPPDVSSRIEDLLRSADDALYRAKSLGRNRVECTHP
jgi:diguanylate cyclase (GGDEF)-like protein